VARIAIVTGLQGSDRRELSRPSVQPSARKASWISAEDELDAYWSHDRYVRRLRVLDAGYYEDDGQRFYFPTLTGIALQESDRTAADGCMEKYEGGSGVFP